MRIVVLCVLLGCLAPGTGHRGASEAPHAVAAQESQAVPTTRRMRSRLLSQARKNGLAMMREKGSISSRADGWGDGDLTVSVFRKDGSRLRKLATTSRRTVGVEPTRVRLRFDERAARLLDAESIAFHVRVTFTPDGGNPIVRRGTTLVDRDGTRGAS